MRNEVVVHRAGGRLGAALRPYAAWSALEPSDELPVLSVDAAPGLPEHGAEARVALAVAAGARVLEGADDPVDGPDDLLSLARDRGTAAVRAARAHPELLPRTALGGWPRARPSARVVRRLLLVLPVLRKPLAGSTRAGAARAAADAAYWAGVRASVTRREWLRLTRAYVVLCYHRAAGEMLPGQERWDISPAALGRQLATLRRFGWRPLGPEALLALHRPGLDGPVPPPRGLVVTFDDGYADAIAAATAHADVQPHVYLCTEEVGQAPGWANGARLATWDEVRAAARAGVVVGSHTRVHQPLTEVPPGDRESQVAGSAEDLTREVDGWVPSIAYPNGRYDADVLARARSAGYRLGLTTVPGRNGAGTSPLELRRVSPKEQDGVLAVLWMAATGERPPRVLGG
jgi:peptidoglycan/xylan/chitin deacetylase (PgdA/CDA1 family)